MKNKISNGLMGVVKVGFWVMVLEFIAGIFAIRDSVKRAKQMEKNYMEYYKSHPDLLRRIQREIQLTTGKSYTELTPEQIYNAMCAIVTPCHGVTDRRLKDSFLSNPKLVEHSLNYWDAHRQARARHQETMKAIREIENS